MATGTPISTTSVATAPVAQASYGPGEALPAVGTPQYAQAQQLAAVKAPAPIAADTLGSGATPITFPPSVPSIPSPKTVTPPSGTTVGTNGLVVPPTPATNTSTNPDTSTSSGFRSWVQSSLGSLLPAVQGEATAQSDAENVAGIPQKQADAISTYNAYQQAQIDQTNTIQSMKTESGGTTAGNAEAIATYKNQTDAHISNLALQANLAQSNYSAAEKIVTDKVNAQLSSVKDTIGLLTTMSTMENNDMTDSEKEQATEKAAELTKQTELFTSASTDAHTVLMKANAPTSAYSQLDAVTTDFADGKITAEEAQSQMDQIVGKYETSSTAALSTTDINNGIANAATDSATFKAYPADVQDFFAKSSDTMINNWNDAVRDVKSGTDPQKAADNASLNLSPNMMSLLKGYAPATSSNSGGGFLGWLKGLFGSGSASSSTSSTTPQSVKIGGQSYNVGDIVVNSKNQRGIVNADGTITPQ